MPSNQYPSSLTYPSDSGSDVHRSASFWLAPSTVSSPACAGQPAKNQHTSDGKGDSPKPRTECPAPEGKTEILKGMDKRQVQSLYSRLCAMGDACGMWSRVLAKSELNEQNHTGAVISATTGQGRYGETAAADRPSKLQAGQEAVLEAAAQSIYDAMKENCLSFSVVVSKKSGECYWKMLMDGILVGKGWAMSLDEMFTAGFYEREREGLKSFM